MRGNVNNGFLPLNCVHEKKKRIGGNERESKQGNKGIKYEQMKNKTSIVSLKLERGEVTLIRQDGPGLVAPAQCNRDLTSIKKYLCFIYL